VSPEAATHGVTYLFLKKTGDLFIHRPLRTDNLFSCRLLTSQLPTYTDVVCSLFFLNSATTKFNFIRVSTPRWCPPERSPPSDANDAK